MFDDGLQNKRTSRAGQDNRLNPARSHANAVGMETRIYKIVTKTLWAEAEKKGRFEGAPVDQNDGYIHFSTAAQTRKTVEKHFAAATDLLLVEADATQLGGDLRWETSRGGALFPHLYGHFTLDSVLSVCELPLASDGLHVFPKDFPA